MRMLTKKEKVLYLELVKFKHRFVPPYKSSMACHAPEDFEPKYGGGGVL